MQANVLDSCILPNPNVNFCDQIFKQYNLDALKQAKIKKEYNITWISITENSVVAH